MDAINSTFEPFPKIARLNRGCVISEKIDGTNAQVWIRTVDEVDPNEDLGTPHHMLVAKNGERYIVMAGSRSRWISPGKTTDNYGFAGWVTDHAHELVDLGPGRHYGEWWGTGIQRGYGLAEKRFSLFNVHRWADEASRPSCVGVVPVLFEGEFSTYAACEAVTRLRMDGSRAAPDFAKPEGIIVYHTAQQSLFKMTLERDAEPKSLAA